MSKYHHASCLAVKASGLPVLYHGTDREIVNFHFRRHRRGGKAIFATPSLMNAQSYGTFVYEVKPISGRMFEPSQENMIELEDAVDKLLEKESKKSDYSKRRSFYPSTRSDVIQGIKDKKWWNIEHPLIIETLKKLKFDGFIAHEGSDVNYAFFDPRNLRIVRQVDIDNNGDDDGSARPTMVQ